MSSLADMIASIQGTVDPLQKAKQIADLKKQLAEDRLRALGDADKAIEQAQEGQLEFLRAVKRGRDLYDSQLELLSAQIPQRVESDVNTTRRQFEINEYEYNRKLNILYALQVTYIALLICVIPFAIAGFGFISVGTSFSISIAVAVIAAILIGYQIWYNRKLRDRAYWNRRYFSYASSEIAGDTSK